ncbi:MAG: hypothetical protein AAB597_02370 [Patescibacteria group bacterium]
MSFWSNPPAWLDRIIFLGWEPHNPKKVLKKAHGLIGVKELSLQVYLERCSFQEKITWACSQLREGADLDKVRPVYAGQILCLTVASSITMGVALIF